MFDRFVTVGQLLFSFALHSIGGAAFAVSLGVVWLEPNGFGECGDCPVPSVMLNGRCSLLEKADRFLVVGTTVPGMPEEERDCNEQKAADYGSHVSVSLSKSGCQAGRLFSFEFEISPAGGPVVME